MSTLDEKLDASLAARPFKDVQVVLDGQIAQQRESLLNELAEAQAADETDPRMGVVRTADVQERLDALADVVADALITLRFTRMPGDVWAEVTSANPIRVDVPLDRHYGYNVDAVCIAAARHRDGTNVYGVMLEDGEPVELTDDQWTKMFHALSGNEVASIRDAIWSLNEFDPQQRINILVKGSGAATRSANK